MKYLKIIAAILLIAYPSCVFAATYYVAQSSAGSGDGSSVSNAMSVSSHNSGSFSAGDVIYLLDTITSQVTVPSSGSSSSNMIRYRGDYSGHEAVINRGNTGDSIYCFNSSDEDYIWVDNVEMTNSGNGIYAYNGSVGLKVTRCYIHDMARRGIEYTDGGYPGFGNFRNSYLTVGGAPGQGNTFKNIGDDTASYDVKLNFVEDVVVSYNEFYAESPYTYGITGISSERWSNFLIEYNKVHNHNRSNGEGGIGMKEARYGIIRYNYVYDEENGEESYGIQLAGDVLYVYIYANFLSNITGKSVFIFDGTGENYSYANGIKPSYIYLWSNLIVGPAGGNKWGVLAGYEHSGYGNPDPTEYIYLYNNTLVRMGQSGYGSGFRVREATSNLFLINNLFEDCRPDASGSNLDIIIIDETPGGTFTVQKNNSYNDGDTAYVSVNSSDTAFSSYGTNNTQVANGFVGSTDFSLSEGAAAIDNGTALSGVVGSVTVQGTVYTMRWDMALYDSTVWANVLTGGINTGDQDDHASWEQGAYIYVEPEGSSPGSTSGAGTIRGGGTGWIN